MEWIGKLSMQRGPSSTAPSKASRNLGRRTILLVAAGRVFTKLEQGSKCSAKSQRWWSKKVYQRRTDPLLCYIWHARNADEHTIEAVTELNPGSIRYVDPSPEEQAKFNEKMKQLGKPYLALACLDVTPPHVRLVDVVDRGNRYSPPQAYPHPLYAGMMVLSQIEAIVIEAEALIV
jgi:hypothetical protein